MIKLVWNVIILPITIIGLVSKLVMFAVIAAMLAGAYFLGEYIGWGNIVSVIENFRGNENEL